MLRTRLVLALLPAFLPGVAPAADISGRWEGVISIPGAAMPLVLDLASGAGSVTLPGRGVSGAPLQDLVQGENALRASLAAAIPNLGASGAGPMIELVRQSDGRLSGSFHLAGLAAPLTLQRSGAAQVQPAPASTPISAELAGTWRGRYELGGYPRDVTLTLKAGAPMPGNVALLIVGKRSTHVTIDRVVQGPVFITFEAVEIGLTIEGRWGGGAIDGTLQQGPFEVPLLLRREGAAS